MENRMKRRGARAARRALRAAPLAPDQRPVKPGQEGGRYRPLTDQDMQRVHEGLKVLRGDGVILSRYQEALVRWRHDLIDEYVERRPVRY